MEKFELIAPCHFGLEVVMKREILDLGYEVSQVEDGRVTFIGDAEAVCRANIFLRTTERILLKVGSFKAETFEELFQGTRVIPWEQYIPRDGKFWVAKASSIKSRLFSPSDIQSIMKKAMVERMKGAYGITWFPEDGASYPLRVFLYKDVVTVAMDTSGDSLHKRGYRTLTSKAPITETLAAALLMAIGLFVVVPHLMSLLMLWLHLGGDVEGLSFHLWDGFFKCCIFMGYIKAISYVPDIRRVFQYHGAEHKTIHAFESGGAVDAAHAARMSRLHPRCGTTFLLFVICISIVLHAVLVPMLLALYTPQSAVAKHALTIFFKLLLMAPISALAYELIRYAARLPEGPLAQVLRAPGLALQKLTTYEPDESQLEVAVVALSEALGPDAGERVRPVPYIRQ